MNNRLGIRLRFCLNWGRVPFMRAFTNFTILALLPVLFIFVHIKHPSVLAIVVAILSPIVLGLDMTIFLKRLHKRHCR